MCFQLSICNSVCIARCINLRKYLRRLILTDFVKLKYFYVCIIYICGHRIPVTSETNCYSDFMFCVSIFWQNISTTKIWKI